MFKNTAFIETANHISLYMKGCTLVHSRFHLFVMRSTSCILLLLLASTSLLKAQNISDLLAPKTPDVQVNTRTEGAYALPQSLGGGEQQSHALVISSPNARSARMLRPEDLGVKDLQPVRWLSGEYFLFIGADALSPEAFFVYYAKEDRVFRCDFDTGESLGYENIPEGAALHLQFSEGIITGYQVLK